jgi:hypothetical protein
MRFGNTPIRCFVLLFLYLIFFLNWSCYLVCVVRVADLEQSLCSSRDRSSEAFQRRKDWKLSRERLTVLAGGRCSHSNSYTLVTFRPLGSKLSHWPLRPRARLCILEFNIRNRLEPFLDDPLLISG